MAASSRIKLAINDLLLSSAALFQCLFGPVAASTGLALLCRWLGWENRPASFWLLLAPAIYVVWLIFLLAFYTLETSLFRLFYQKPRRFDSRQKDGRLNFLITLVLYGHGFIVASLPLIRMLARSQIFVRLILRSYSTRVNISQGGWPGGEISDPDITTFGAGIVIGDGCHIIAHAINRSPEGSIQFQSAPIELWDKCTIGGGARIEMGVIVGAGSLVEPHSRVAAFTRIPPDEVWGGSPAVFRRQREATPGASSPPGVAQSVPGVHAAVETGKLFQLIADALEIPAAQVNAETSSKNCAAWDSVGRMAIAAALHDRFGIYLSQADIDALDCIPRVEKVIRAKNGAHPTILPTNPELLPLLDPATVLAALTSQADPANTPRKKIRVVIAATFIATPLASALKSYCRAFGLEAEVEFFDFNQVPQALLSPESPMRRNREGLNVVLIRPEDWPGKTSEERRGIAGQFLEAVKNFAATSGSALLVGDLPPVISPELQDRPAETAGLQTWWRQQLAAISGLPILPFAEIIEELGKAAARPVPEAGGAVLPFSLPVYQHLGITLARVLRKMSRAPKKVLALDADNLLWGGVVGEDGTDGIQLSDEAEGRPFRALQTAILALKKRGVLLVLASKNSADDVWQVLDHHPHAILRRNDFAAARINWQPKSQNLRELADELNLGIDSFVFLDDNAAERLEVAANCPTVTVVPLPSQPDRYAEILSRLWCFDGTGETAEDGQRNEFAQQESQRKELERSLGGLDSYLQALEIKVSMRSAREDDLPRVSQLLQKTNQFNLSLKRRTLPETRALVPAHDIWVVSVCDRLGDYGLVGVCITRPENGSLYLDTLLMSCRALGRGAETAFLHAITAKGRALGARSLRGEFVTGSRNQPMEQFLQKSGFIRDQAGICVLALEHTPAAPSHLKLEIE